MVISQRIKVATNKTPFKKCSIKTSLSWRNSSLRKRRPSSRCERAVNASCDVLVIGAGAAGGAARLSISLPQAIALWCLKRDAASRVKPCGGGMAASVQQWFPFSLEPAVEQVISEVDFSWCLTDPVVAELPGDAPFWIVARTARSTLAGQAV